MENPIKIHDLGVPLLLETPIYISCHISSFIFHHYVNVFYFIITGVIISPPCPCPSFYQNLLSPTPTAIENQEDEATFS